MGKRKVISEAELKELVLPAEGEVLGRMIKLLGSDHILVKCVDGKTRVGRIRGKLKRKIWVRDNDIVLLLHGNSRVKNAVILCGGIPLHRLTGYMQIITCRKIFSCYDSFVKY